MDEFKLIVVMNEAMLRLHKDDSLYAKIKECLKDEAFFFKIDKLTATKILVSVGVKKEQLNNVYKKLISPSIYYDLERKGIIHADDKKLKIKYDSYNNDIFKKK